MTKFTRKDKRTNIEKEIDDLAWRLSKMDPCSREYSEMVSILERLIKVKTGNENNKISKDTIAIICGNLLGIVLILGYERANVITSKALGFVLKGRV